MLDIGGMWAIRSSMRTCTVLMRSTRLTVFRYYILRNDMMGYYLNDIQERLANRLDSSGWEVGCFVVSRMQMHSFVILSGD